jgi:16S rRNA (guanine(966)-N(2))-methyltransferase RsmD
MRVISGSARSIPLQVPKGEVRPTTDRVREAAFSLMSGMLDGARCLDLFAGSGALGIEALSRGASSCLFVDQSQDCCDTVGANLAKAKLSERADVRCQEVTKYLRGARRQFDLVFADPPYARDGVDDLAATLAISEDLVARMAPGATLLLESRSGSANTPCHERLKALDVRQYGESRLEFFRHARD